MMKFLSAIILFSFVIQPTLALDTKPELIYLVRQPKIRSVHPPVIILLHGYGSNEEDLFSFADQLPSKYLIISVRAPRSIGGNAFAWYNLDFSQGELKFVLKEEEESRAVLIHFIEQISQKFSVNASEIYLCGFSQGAMMSYSIALTRPKLIKGIAVLSGRLLDEIKPKILRTKDLMQLKIFISHGKNDGTIPVSYARTALAYLKSLHLNPQYKEYNSVHEVNSENLRDLIQWLN